MILVLGSGRSGTHWLGHILDSHPSITATIEDPRFFAPVVAMALDAREREAHFAPLVAAYKSEAHAVRPNRFADKSHPNIWLAGQLADALPEAQFVGIEREVHATVASMLNHTGVLSWHDRWLEFPVPNPFLGITADMASRYQELSVIEKCVLRWLSHRDEMVSLRDQLGGRLHVIEYESLFSDPANETDQLQNFLGLDEPFPLPQPAGASLDRWRDNLTPDQITQIRQAIVDMSPSSPPRSRLWSRWKSRRIQAHDG